MGGNRMIFNRFTSTLVSCKDGLCNWNLLTTRYMGGRKAKYEAVIEAKYRTSFLLP